MTDETLFSDALAIPDAAGRAAFLDRACPDPVQRQRVAELLAALSGTNPLDRPPADLGKTGAYSPETVDAEPTAAVGDRVGPYKLLEKIGEGGMGEVWVADQLEPIKRRVALKLIKPGMDSRSVLGRFEAERQALAVMDHPNIAKVLDAGTVGQVSNLPSDPRQVGNLPHYGRPYFVMELVKGTPITEFCDARKLTPKQRLELFVPVCQAIQHAHMKGIIHRDIMPSNVLVALHDETPVPKVIDFGVAKAVGQQLTEKTIYTGFGALVGTPAYMAPEQATFNQLDVDTRADVYALGVLLYELLAGSPPIEKERLKKAALDEVLRIVRDEEPPRPSQRLSTSQAKASIAATRQTDPTKLSALMKGEIDWIVMKALEKDRTRRYDTANGLAKDIQRYLTGDAVEACPPTLGYRLRKAYRRNRAAVWVATAFTLLMAVGVAMASLLAIRATNAERVASAERDAALIAQAEANDQRAHANRERQRAEEEKRAAEAVRAFLQKDLLGQANLINQAEVARLTGQKFAAKRNPTVNELIERAATLLAPDKIEAKFPNMPFVQAEVLKAVGEAYGAIGQDKKALSLLNRAVTLYSTARGPDDAATLAARHQLGLTLWYCDRQDEGLSFLEVLLRDRERVLGPYHPDTFDTRIHVALIKVSGNGLADLVGELGRIRDDARTHLGPLHYQTIYVSGQYIAFLLTTGRSTEAIREIEAWQTATAGNVLPDHPFHRIGQIMLTDAYLQTGQAEKAVTLLEKLVPAITAQLGADDPTTLHFVGRLSRAYQQTGQTDQALPLLQQTLAAARRANGPLALGIQTGVYELCLTLAQRGRHDEAAAVAREQATAVREKAGANSPKTAMSLMILGRVLMWQPGVPKDGEQPMREAIAVYRAIGDTASADYSGALSNFGLFLVRQGRHADAEPILRECLALREKQSAVSWIRFNAASTLGASLLGQGKQAEAEPLLKSGYEGVKARKGELHAVDRIRFAEAAQRLADLYAATGRGNQAAELRAEAASFIRELAPPPRPAK